MTSSDRAPGASRYDAVADEYEAMFNRGVDDPATQMLLELVGDVGQQRVLDAPCGEGRVARELARRGASVLGVDLSTVLIDKARALTPNDASLRFEHRDITAPDALERERFDAAVCNYGFSDIDDLDGALSTFARVIRPGGVLVFSLLHPCFGGWTGVDGAWPPEGYYDEHFWRPQAVGSLLRNRVGAHHRMLSTYLNSLVAHGFILDAFAERGFDPWPLPDITPQPMFLAGRCRKPN